MNTTPVVRAALKRGALLVAANWPVVTIQLVAESIFKALLAVPILGGALLVVILLGGDVGELLSRDLHDILSIITTTLLSRPLALAGFALACVVALLSGAAFTFLIKGGTVRTLALAEATTGAIERPPLRAAAFNRAFQFSVDHFVASSASLFRRYLRLGLILIALYGISATLYLLALFSGYRIVVAADVPLAWTLVAFIASMILFVWITCINLLYLLTQMVIAVENVSVRKAFREVRAFLRARARETLLALLIVVALVVLATLASILATTGLGLISFVPFAGFAVFPLQIAAWVVRGMVFQYLGLTSLSTYLTLYRGYLHNTGRLAATPEPHIIRPSSSWSRSA